MGSLSPSDIPVQNECCEETKTFLMKLFLSAGLFTVGEDNGCSVVFQPKKSDSLQLSLKNVMNIGVWESSHSITETHLALDISGAVQISHL